MSDSRSLHAVNIAKAPTATPIISNDLISCRAVRTFRSAATVPAFSFGAVHRLRSPRVCSVVRAGHPGQSDSQRPSDRWFCLVTRLTNPSQANDSVPRPTERSPAAAIHHEVATCGDAEPNADVDRILAGAHDPSHDPTRCVVEHDNRKQARLDQLSLANILPTDFGVQAPIWVQIGLSPRRKPCLVGWCGFRSRFAKVRVAGSNPVVRSKRRAFLHRFS